jgi:hypothetical protein
MSTWIAAGAVIALLIAVAFVFLFRKLASPGRRADLNPDRPSDFSLEKYRPMERLFSQQDYEFLSSQPGFSPKLVRRLRAERRRIFRRYLQCLSRDFDRLYAATKLLLLHAPEDRPDLALTLLRQRMTFRYALATVHLRLALQTLGLGTVDVRGLVGAVEALRDQLRALSAQPAALPVYER